MHLADVAPRLALALEDYKAEAAWDKAQRMRFSDRKLHYEALIAHRELQLIRAQYKGNRKYIAKRQRKLVEAHEEMAALHIRPWPGPFR